MNLLKDILWKLNTELKRDILMLISRTAIQVMRRLYANNIVTECNVM